MDRNIITKEEEKGEKLQDRSLDIKHNIIRSTNNILSVTQLSTGRNNITNLGRALLLCPRIQFSNLFILWFDENYTYVGVIL